MEHSTQPCGRMVARVRILPLMIEIGRYHRPSKAEFLREVEATGRSWDLEREAPIAQWLFPAVRQHDQDRGTFSGCRCGHRSRAERWSGIPRELVSHSREPEARKRPHRPKLSGWIRHAEGSPERKRPLSVGSGEGCSEPAALLQLHHQQPSRLFMPPFRLDGRICLVMQGPSLGPSLTDARSHPALPVSR